MSEYHEIFIHPGSPVDQLVADISSACGVELRPIEGEFIAYSAKIGSAAVELELSHEYEEDRGMAFEAYDSLITVRDFDSDLARQEATARRVFSNLASLQKYRLMLVFDVQQFIESATPPVGGEHGSA
jgi:hypothetical protein